MTPKEVLHEWAKGCSVTQWEGDPIACDECNDVMLDAMRRAFHEEAELLCQSCEGPASEAGPEQKEVHSEK